MTQPTMRAVSQQKLGGPEVLEQVELPRPSPGPAEMLVRVEATSVNPTDFKHRANGGFLGRPPFTLGWDVAGVVEEVGLGVALFQPGDPVLGMLPYPGRAGAYAEYVVSAPRRFVRRPAEIDVPHAGALPLVSLTAWQALVDIGNVSEGDRVLVHAAAGGVGHMAVQIAKAKGAYVIGTASAAKHDFVRSLGADEMIDYTSEDFTEKATDIDIVLDTIGGEHGPRSVSTMRPGGTIVTLVVSNVHPDFVPRARERGVRPAAMLVEPDHAALRSITELYTAGRLRVELADVYPMSRVQQAHAVAERGRTAGKIALTWD
jgi:NADPH:quinone reductase-like Zn-dependent oxidoreductase